MIYKISEDQVESVMKSLLDVMGVKYNINYMNDNRLDSITATVFLYKDNEVLGNRQGYDFFFHYDKRFNKLTSEGNYPELQNQSLFKMVPEEVVKKFFTDKVQEYLTGFINRGSSGLRGVIQEEMNSDSMKSKQQIKLIEKLLDGASLEGVCNYSFRIDRDNDKVSGVYLIFDSKWYRASDDRDSLNTKLLMINRTKVNVQELINTYLNIENLYVDSYLEDCDL